MEKPDQYDGGAKVLAAKPAGSIPISPTFNCVMETSKREICEAAEKRLFEFPSSLSFFARHKLPWARIWAPTDSI
jgi:hypothetical protein